MWKAIDNASSLVPPGGHLVLAIYNCHWNFGPWLAIKRAYVAVPEPIQKLLNGIFVPVIYLVKLTTTPRNPLRMERGMDFYYNVVGWISGYPYKYADHDEIESYMKPRGFSIVRFVPTIVLIGCNEFVLRRCS